jgi:transposase
VAGLAQESGGARAIQYALPRWDGLTRYCENGALAIDNNLSERMVRPVAIGRKNWMFLGSDNGGKAAAILYSVMASAKANQVEPFAYVRDLLVRLSSQPPIDLSGLLPDEWLKMHPEARRRWSR